MIKCPNCGAELSFSAESQLVTCEYCRSTFNPKELKISVKTAEEKKSPNTYEGKSYNCSQCGATLLTFDETAITFCSYCGSQAMLESKMMLQNNPDFIIPFKKTKEECISAYKTKVSKSLFAPSYMKSDIVVNKFRGIYIPYGIYKVSFHDRSVNKGKKYRYRSGDYEYYDDYKIFADIDADYNGISYDLISNFYDKFSHSIPHNFKESEAFNPNYLTGFYADAVDVDNSLYEEVAESIAITDSVNHLQKIKEFSRYGCSIPKVDFKVSEKKVGMFPIYFLAIRDKKNKYVNYAVVNGQTGKVAIDLPIDFKKYILISFLLTIPIFLLINNFLVIVPKNICIFSIFASIVSIVISRYQLKKIYERENHLDDIGYVKKISNIEYKIQTKSENKAALIILLLGVFALFFIFPYIVIYFDLSFLRASMFIMCFVLLSVVIGFTHISKKQNNLKTNIKITVNKNKIKISKKEKFKYTYKSALAILIGLIVLVCNFVNDIYYYGASLIMFGLIIWSFYDLIKEHNLLVSTKLPQLEKRGGRADE